MNYIRRDLLWGFRLEWLIFFLHGPSKTLPKKTFLGFAIEISAATSVKIQFETETRIIDTIGGRIRLGAPQQDFPRRIGRSEQSAVG
jgi:hypothetical protein